MVHVDHGLDNTIPMLQYDFHSVTIPLPVGYRPVGRPGGGAVGRASTLGVAKCLISLLL